MRVWRRLRSVILLLILLGARSSLCAADEPPQQLSTYWSPRVQRWSGEIIQEARRRELDPDFLASLVWMESRGDSQAVGPVGAVGLMQVMSKEAGFAWRPTKQQLLDPKTNLFWGTRTLATVIQQGHGDIFNALAAYNGGWEQVRYRGPRYFATTILRDYAHAVAQREGVQERWIAFFAVQNSLIHGPIWIADSARADVYYFSDRNWVPDGTELIPEVPPTAVVARWMDHKTQIAYVVGVWLYCPASDRWLTTGRFAPLVSNTPVPTSTPRPTATPSPLLATATTRPTAHVTVTPTPTSSPTPTPTAIATAKSEAVVLEGGAELRLGASLWWYPNDTLPPGTKLEVLGHDPHFPGWIYVQTVDHTLHGWTQVENVRWADDVAHLPVMTPRPTLTPSPTPTLTPQPTPTLACAPEELWAEAWPAEKQYSLSGGWTVKLFARGHGGNCVYTYAWNTPDNVIAGPTSAPVFFNISTPRQDANIVGTVWVISGDQQAKVGIFVSPPGSN